MSNQESHGITPAERDALAQELLELHFGCHPDPEALQARLANDPALRRLQQEVAGQAELLEAAARPEQPQLRLNETRTDRRWFHLRTPLARIRTVTLGAAATVAAVTLAHLWAKFERDRFAAEHLALTVSAPRAIPAGAPWQFTIEAEDLANQPTDAAVNWRVLGKDEAVLADGDTTVHGRAVVAVPAKLGNPVRVVVTARNADDLVSHTFELSSAAAGPLCHLTTDRPIYRPGETIYARALTLDRVTLAPREPSGDGRCVAKLLDAKGALVAQAIGHGESDVRGTEGIRGFAFPIPDDSPGGVHTIEFAAADGSIPIERTEVVVRPFRAPKLRTAIVLDRTSYSPGARGSARVEVERMGGERAAGAAVTAAVVIDGTEVWREQRGLDAEGRAMFAFAVPQQVAKGAARFVATVTDGGVVEAELRPFLVPTGIVTLNAFPEGGELVADVPNRMYLECTDPLGRYVDTGGALLDDRGTVVTKFRTEHQGRARLEFTPKLGERYRVQLAGQETPTELPLPKADGIALCALGDGIAAGESLRLRLAGRGEGPWLAAVFCRGVLVGQASAGADERGELQTELAVPLLEHASGVLRVTIFNRRLEPVAERLVRRIGDRRIDVAITARDADVTPGASQQLTVRTTDERGTPLAAIVGVTVTDLAVTALGSEPRLGLADHAALFADVERVERLGDFLLSAAEAPRNVDLLLGTRGWRRFVWRNDAAAQAAIAARGQWGASALAREGFSQTPQVRTTVSLAGGSYAETADRVWRWQRYRNALGALAIAVALLYALIESLAVALRRSGRTRHPILVSTVVVAGSLLGFAILLPNTLGARADALAMAPGAVAELWDAGEPKRVETFAEVPAALLPDGFDIFSIGPAANPLAGAFFNDGADGDVRARSENYFGQPQPPASAQDEVLQEDFEVEVANGAVINPGGRIRLPRVYQPLRAYLHRHTTTAERTDFPATICWTTFTRTDAQGTATLAFDTGDQVTTWQVHADAHTPGVALGRVGQGATTFRTRLPLALDVKLPDELAAGDQLDVPIDVEVRNDFADSVELRVQLGDGLVARGALPTEIQLSGGRGRALLPLTARQGTGEAFVRLDARAGGLEDRLARRVTIVPRGFPHRRSHGGQVASGSPATLALAIPGDAGEGTGRASFTLYPSPLAALTAGLEGMLQEPHGCFEQASSANYPNTLVLTLLEASGDDVPAIAARARDLLPRGYRKITGYECKELGYEWFGGDPGHEALTAYGLLQFADMQRVYTVDAGMVDRTKQWLLGRRDGKGGFLQSSRGLDTFGRAPQSTTNAYVAYALLLAGVAPEDLRAELDALIGRIDTADAYELAATACALAAGNRGQDAARARAALASRQQPDGALQGATTSITRSGGRDLAVETAAFATLAWLPDPTYATNVRRAVEFLQNSRGGNGTFGATQATVMALRALTAYAKATRAMRAPGTVRIRNGERLLAERDFVADEHEPIRIDLWPLLTPGEHALTVELVGGGDAPLPWACDVEYRSEQPADDAACVLALHTALRAPRVAEGESVALDVKVTNRTDAGQPMAIAVVGLPAGLEVPTATLTDLQREGAFAFWELRGRELALYWRDLAPGATKELTLDLLARVPGRSTGPASRVNLYYTPTQRQWAAPLAVEVIAR